MAKQDPNVAAHLEWLGFVRPTGLVVSAPTLASAGAILDRRDTDTQRRLRDCVVEHAGGAGRPRSADETGEAPVPRLPDFRAFAESVLDWNFSPRAYAGTDEAPIPPELEAALPEAGAVLRPDFAVRSERLTNAPRPAPAPASSVRKSTPAAMMPESPPAATVQESAPTATVQESTPLRESTPAAKSRDSPPAGAGRESTPAYGTPAGSSDWQLLVYTCGASEDFDRPARSDGLDASPHGRLERLLRHTGVPAGLLFNGVAVRLVSAPRGESSGWLDFRVADMLETSGRPIAAALRLLLGQTRLLLAPRGKRLAALLADSRRYQNDVSERLAEQVLHALHELLRGLQAAHDASRGALLRKPLAEGPDEIYRALLAVLLRLVFLLYAEQRDMLPDDDTFRRAYSPAALYERLREDAALHPDTMDQRYGAWPQLVALFRIVHDGAAADGLTLPPRRGALFDPDRYPFLEGRTGDGARQVHERIEPPLVPDGTVYRVLDKLLVLGGERVSYRALDVEHIGSVYETMMGFRLETAAGRSLAVKAAKKHGAPATVNLDALLAEAPARRAKWVQDRTDRRLTDNVKKAVQAAGALEDLHAALDPVVDRHATPDLVPAGALVLQPSPERRRSGSHYTPRALTEPIVREALAPVLDRLRAKRDGAPAGAPPGGTAPTSDAPGGAPPGNDAPAGSAPAGGTAGNDASAGGTPDGPFFRAPLLPDEILDLRVCDPAMGSGAFLVEACRQIGEALVEAWRAHGGRPADTAGANDVIAARRLVAQRCLYGVDRNPVAVDLAKLSLWLATLAKEESFTFLDHALRQGDSLVGLSRRQIATFHWKADAPGFQPGFEAVQGAEHLARAGALRQRIREAGPTVTDRELFDLWDESTFEAHNVRLLGDLALAAFFEGDKPKPREAHRQRFADAVRRGEMAQHRGWLETRRRDEPPLAPFHWEIEFPEVFERENPGFDAIVGNPPFLGGKRISTVLGSAYRDWLAGLHNDSSSNADLVAHFFRRAFTLLRHGGTFGLIATNTIAQGDTRSTGLRWICTHGGEIYQAHRRRPWPGQAAVVVSLLHVHKGSFTGVRLLDDARTNRITAFLFHRGGHDDPARLRVNVGKSFVGSYVLGMGFTFDDTDTKGVASSLAEKRRLIKENSRNREAILPYIGGEEVNTSPTHAHHRFVINFRDYPLRRKDLGDRPASTRRDTAGCADRPASAAATWADATDEQRRAWMRNGIVPPDYLGPVAADWPELLAIVEKRVKPERDVQNRKALSDRWWQYADKRPGLYAAVAGLERVLVTGAAAVKYHMFARTATTQVYSHKLIVFPLATYSCFCALQSRVHEVWSAAFGATFGAALTYNATDVFETFPFPDAWETHADLESAGERYHDFRADLMVRRGEGLTRTYNRFHDPNEDGADIATLRSLHAAMDRAVLDAYGWRDIPNDYEFLLDYEIDEDEWGARKKPYRYRWPDDIRDEVLARLLELNAERAAEEAQAGTAASAAHPLSAPPLGRPARRRARASRVAEARPLWGTSDD